MAARLRTFVRPGGHLVLVSEMHRPGRIPQQVKELIAEFLGAYRRPKLDDEEEVLAAAGWRGPQAADRPHRGDADPRPGARIAEVCSMSASTRHRFGARLAGVRPAAAASCWPEPEVIPYPATLARIWTSP